MTAARKATIVSLIAGLVSAPIAAADTLTKEQCVDAHSRGQDAKDQGKLSVARKLFLSCAQASCPALVQGDCARFADDLTRQQSSLTFVARDAQGTDLPDTAVYVDDALVVTRLDDGKPHDVDPGKHVVRFSSAGKEQTVTLVVGTGEKGRAVVATFSSINPPTPGTPGRAGAEREPRQRGPKTTHPSGASFMMIGGAAAAAAGATLGIVGVLKVPSSCSISTTQCAAPPGDPVFADAKSAMQLANVGIVVGAVGVAAFAGGLYWYVSGAKTERDPNEKVVIPLVTGDTAGVALSGRF